MIAFLDRRDRVTVSGPDTWTFLQNLLSQDLDGLADGETRPTLLLTPQGKVDVVATITRRGDDAVLATDPGWGARLADGLTRFKIRTKVEITVEPAPAVDDATADAEERERIAAGVPRLGVDLDDSVIPQEAFLEVDAVSFTKGCFIGQELVCRIDSRGHVNRFLRQLVPERRRRRAARRRGDHRRRQGRRHGHEQRARHRARLRPPRGRAARRGDRRRASR